MTVTTILHKSFSCLSCGSWFQSFASLRLRMSPKVLDAAKSVPSVVPPFRAFRDSNFREAT
jgi:hypothetical protein